jgi:origin recognition complex subunit 3
MQTTQQSLANSHTTHYKLTSNYHRDNDWQLSKVKWLTNQIIYHRESIQNRGMFQKQPVITLETGLNPGFCESFNGLMARELGSLSEKFFVRYCNLKEDLMLVRGESRKFRGLVHRVFNDLAREFNPEQNTNNESEVINSINLQDYKQFINNQDTIRHDQGDHRMNLNILLLPNWERFNLSLLEQLITYLIPLQLVILLPTSTSTSDTLPTLPYTLTSRLSCLKLNFQNPWKDLEQGLNFLSDVESNGLQLGIWPLLRLGKNFLNFNYSTSNWYSEFKWCLLDYYKSNALSVLIGNIGKPNYIGFIKEDVVPNLVDSHFDMVRALPSFKYWLSKSTQSNEDKLKLIQDNTHFKDNFLIPKLQSLQIYLINYKQAFDLVVQLQKWVYELELSDTELDSKLYLKLEGLTRGLPNSSVLEILLNQVETLNFQKLSILLKSLITFVNAQKSKLIRKTSAVEKFIEYLNELKELLVKYGNGEYNLKHTPNKKLANVLSQYFKIVLQPNYEVVLNELVFVMDDTLISKTFDPNLQDLLHLDLHQPDLELTSSTSNFNPDLCILYEIYLECGRLINLYDWSKAFEDRIIAQSTGKAPSKDIIYGRFLLGLETFKLWGLVATTKRKTDHVVKLI